MKKIFSTILITLLLVAAILFAASQLLDIQLLTGKHAIVTINNESDKDIKRLALVHKGGFFEKNELPSKGKTQFIFENSTENSYSVFAVFENDSIVKSRREYIEYGHRGKLIVTDTGIAIEF